MARRLIIAGIVLAVLVIGVLVAGDAIAKPMVERRIAEEIQQRYGLAERPSVSIDSFPFAIDSTRGAIDHLEVRADDVVVEGLTVDHVELDIFDLHYSLTEVLKDRESARADHVEATVLLSQPALNRYLVDQQLAYVVTLTEDRITVTGVIDVAGLQTQATATGALSIVDGTMQFTATDVSVPGTTLDPTGLSVAIQLLSFAVPIPEVVGVRLTAVDIVDGFATLDAEIDDYWVMGGGE